MAEDRDEVVADISIVFDGEQAAKFRLKPEHWKIRSRDEQPLTVQGLAAIRQVGVEGDVGRDASEYRLQPLEITKHRIAENLVAAASLPAGRRAGLGPWRRQIDEFIRPCDRDRAQKSLVV